MASNQISAWWDDAPTDSGVEKIVSSIKRAEGAGYETPGASGESGAYQYKPDTWKKWSTGYTKETLGKPAVLPMTEQNQDNVTRFAVKSLLAEGHSPEQIFSIWNSGQPDWRGKVGVNSAGVRYDTPAYVQKAKSFYDKIKDVFVPSEAHAAEVATNKPPIVWPDDLGAQSTAPRVPVAPVNPMVPPAAGIERPESTPAATSRPPIVWPDDLGIIQAEKGKAPSGIPDRSPPIASPVAITIPQWWMAERAQKPETKLKYLAGKIFPTEKPEDAMKRFYIDEGRIYYQDNDQQTYEVVPEGGKLTQKLTPFASPGMIGSVVGGLLGGRVGAPNMGMIAGGIAGGVADTAISEFGMGEPQKIVDYGISGAKEGVYATIGAGIGKGATRAYDMVASKTFGPLGRQLLRDQKFSWTAAEVRALQQLAHQEFGIDLTLPELTNSNTLKRVWNSMAKSPGEAGEKIQTFMQEIRKPQIRNAIEAEIKAIHPETSIFELSKAGSEAASSVLQDLRGYREGVSGPLFKKARATNPEVDTSPIMGSLEAQIAESLPAGQKKPVLEHVKTLLTKEEITIDPTTGEEIKRMVPETSLAKLDEVKHELNAMLDKPPKELAITKSLRGQIKDIKNSLVDLLEQSSPEYAKAMDEWRLLSRDVNKFLWGVDDPVMKRKYRDTILSSIEKLNSEDVVRAPKMLFGNNSSPEAVRLAKAFIKDRYPSTMDPLQALEQRRGWDALVAAHIRETLQSVVGEGNLGWSFRKKLFGNAETGSKQREMMKVAMGDDLYRRWDAFADILDKTGRIVYQNSETAMMMAAEKAKNQTLSNPLYEWLRKGVFSPAKLIGEKLGDAAIESNSVKLVGAMMDPASTAVLEHIKRMPSTAKKAIEFATVLTAIHNGESWTSLSNNYFPGGAGQQKLIQGGRQPVPQPQITQPQIWQSETGAVPGLQSAAPRVPIRTGRDKVTGRIVHDYGNGVIEYAV